MPPINSPSDVTSNPSAYHGKTIELSGQTYLTGSPPRLLIDGKSGVNISGNIVSLQKGFYRLKGVYNADTNTLNVTESIKEETKYLAIEAGKKLGINLVPIQIEGLIATPPAEVANMLTNYLSITNFSANVPIYPYVVYAKEGFYLALSDTLTRLPAEFPFLYQGKNYGFTFSAGEVKGTLVKIPLEKINFGSKWQPVEFGGVVIAESIQASQPVSATVQQISDNPEAFAFKRVNIHGTYLVTTATVDYSKSEIKIPFGAGILADNPSALFFEEKGPRLVTLDPKGKVWQLRQTEVIGTVLSLTPAIRNYLNYSKPLVEQQVRDMVKPALSALIVEDAPVDNVVSVDDIKNLNPLVGSPSQYWGEVAEFDGYALGGNIRLKDVVEAIVKIEIPINVNVLVLDIADSPTLGAQLAIIGLNNDLLDKGGKPIVGRFKFRVAVTKMPVKLADTESANTAFFLLSKEELPVEIPTLLPTVPVPTFNLPTTSTLTPSVPPTIPAPTFALPATPTIPSTITPAPTFVPPPTPTPMPTPTPTPIPATYALNVSVSPSGTGSVIFTPSGGNYRSGTVVTLTAVPALGYSFDHWSGDISGTSPITAITVGSNKSVIASFKRGFP